MFTSAFPWVPLQLPHGFLCQQWPRKKRGVLPVCPQPGCHSGLSSRGQQPENPEVQEERGRSADAGADADTAPARGKQGGAVACVSARRSSRVKEDESFCLTVPVLWRTMQCFSDRLARACRSASPSLPTPEVFAAIDVVGQHMLSLLMHRLGTLARCGRDRPDMGAATMATTFPCHPARLWSAPQRCREACCRGDMATPVNSSATTHLQCSCLHSAPSARHSFRLPLRGIVPRLVVLHHGGIPRPGVIVPGVGRDSSCGRSPLVRRSKPGLQTPIHRTQ